MRGCFKPFSASARRVVGALALGVALALGLAAPRVAIAEDTTEDEVQESWGAPSDLVVDGSTFALEWVDSENAPLESSSFSYEMLVDGPQNNQEDDSDVTGCWGDFSFRESASDQLISCVSEVYKSCGAGEYIVRLRYRENSGEEVLYGAWSNEASFNVTDDMVMSKPTNVSIDNSWDLTWQVSGVGTGLFDIQLSFKGSAEYVSGISGRSINNVELVANSEGTYCFDLAPYIEEQEYEVGGYYAYVVCHASGDKILNGVSEMSETKTLSAPESTLVAPTNLSLGTGGTTLNWADENGDSTKHYVVGVFADDAVSPIIKLDVYTLSVDLAELMSAEGFGQSSLAFTAKVKAISKNVGISKNSAWSDGVRFRADGRSQLEAPTGLATSSSGGVATLTWTIPSDTLKIAGYEVAVWSWSGYTYGFAPEISITVDGASTSSASLESLMSYFSDSNGCYICVRSLPSDSSITATSDWSAALGPCGSDGTLKDRLPDMEGLTLSSDLTLSWTQYSDETADDACAYLYATDADGNVLEYLGGAFIPGFLNSTSCDLKALIGLDSASLGNGYYSVTVWVSAKSDDNGNPLKLKSLGATSSPVMYSAGLERLATPTELIWSSEAPGTLTWKSDALPSCAEPKVVYLAKALGEDESGVEGVSSLQPTYDEAIGLWSVDLSSLMESGYVYYATIQNTCTAETRDHADSLVANSSGYTYTTSVTPGRLNAPTDLKIEENTLTWSYTATEGVSYRIAISPQKAGEESPQSGVVLDVNVNPQKYDLSQLLSGLSAGETYTIWVMALSQDPTLALDSEAAKISGTVPTPSTPDPTPTPTPSGGGSATPTTPTTDETTTTNPDGSTTTTVVDESAGTKTETTKKTDGSTVEKVTDTKTGAATTTATAADGTTAKTETDKDGKVTAAEATVSAEAAEEAAKTGEAVLLPVEAVEAADDAADAPAIVVSVPANTEVKVVVPVAEGTGAGATVVKVRADGTTEVVPKVAATEDGLALTLAQGETLKVVDNSVDFPDVSEGVWYEEAAQFASSRGLVTGSVAADGTATFQGDTGMSRGMLATVLNRLESSPEATAEHGFEDVAEGAWYEAGVAWAAEKGIVQGYGDGSSFGPDNGVTREELAVMLYRYADMLGLDTTGRADLSGYADASQLTFGADAMSWAVSAGLIKGYGNGGTLGGANGLTRAECATVLQRLVSYLV